jgi:hypothetical protein
MSSLTKNGESVWIPFSSLAEPVVESMGPAAEQLPHTSLFLNEAEQLNFTKDKNEIAQIIQCGNCALPRLFYNKPKQMFPHPQAPHFTAEGMPQRILISACVEGKSHPCPMDSMSPTTGQSGNSHMGSGLRHSWGGWGIKSSPN